MPYEWISSTRPKAKAELHLWPYRSLPKKGFVTFFGASFCMVALPLFAVLGSPILWGILPFFVVVLGGAWWALQRSYRDGELFEELVLWPDRITLTRKEPKSPDQHWEANPYWVRVHDHGQNARIEHYLTLQGGPREVEIGSFLSVEERVSLSDELSRKIHDVVASGQPN